MRLHQGPESRRQVVGANVLPGLGLCREIRLAVHHQAGIQALEHGEQLGLVGAGEHGQHLAI